MKNKLAFTIIHHSKDSFSPLVYSTLLVPLELESAN